MQQNRKGNRGEMGQSCWFGQQKQEQQKPSIHSYKQTKRMRLEDIGSPFVPIETDIYFCVLCKDKMKTDRIKI